MVVVKELDYLGYCFVLDEVDGVKAEEETTMKNGGLH